MNSGFSGTLAQTCLCYGGAIRRDQMYPNIKPFIHTWQNISTCRFQFMFGT